MTSFFSFGADFRDPTANLESVCLMPPSLTRELHFLVLSIFSADGMPCMDRKVLGVG